MSVDYAAMNKMAAVWDEFRGGDLAAEFDKLAEPAGKFDPQAQVVSEAGARRLANLAFGAALKVTYEAAAHFYVCQLCAESGGCHKGQEFARRLGLAR